MKKGSQIGVDGRVQTRSYENKEGQTVFVTEIQAESVQFLEPRGMTQQRPGGGGYNDNQGYQQNRPPQQQQLQVNKDRINKVLLKMQESKLILVTMIYRSNE